MFDKNLKLTRRGVLGGSIAAAAGLITGANIFSSSASAASKKINGKKRSIRFAHLTDIHIEPKRKAPEGFTAALRHVQSQKDKPDMIITGGDNVMDLLGAKDDWAKVQTDTFKEIIAKECELPIKYCIGNHDTWGWDKKNSNTTGDEPLWGKARFVKEFGLENRYYAIDAGKWRILMLDSTHIDKKDVYTAKFDDEQYDWLVEQLKSNQGKYICLINHIPIMSAAVLLDGDNIKQGRWSLPDEWMHLDTRKLVDLFWQNKNVKLCISGHLHLLERLEYNNVTYICDGAVCGGWWGGPFHECQEGYGLFDLYDDGTFDHQYVDYGWEVK
ncbi:MAG TPA: metallophosphoesterase [Phycisphaerales bacterium]|nr:metallophosphoesterase [Phycisphaerales bacterium]